MPEYCYSNKKRCETIVRVFSMGHALDAVKHNGAYYKRDLVAEHNGFKQALSCWPLTSDAAGVHPTQVREATEHAARMGIPTEFTRDGAAVFRDRTHRKKFLKAHGLRDLDAGYGD